MLIVNCDGLFEEYQSSSYFFQTKTLDFKSLQSFTESFSNEYHLVFIFHLAIQSQSILKKRQELPIDLILFREATQHLYINLQFLDDYIRFDSIERVLYISALDATLNSGSFNGKTFINKLPYLIHYNLKIIFFQHCIFTKYPLQKIIKNIGDRPYYLSSHFRHLFFEEMHESILYL